MGGWTDFWLRRSSWILVVAAIASLVAFSSIFMVADDSAWGAALAGGGGQLPETQAGLPSVEPARSIDALKENDAIGAYLTWQAIDIPYALLNLAVVSAAISLFLRKAGWTAARALLLIPIGYVAMELVENSLVAAFAVGAAPPFGPASYAQQIATTLKFVFGVGGLALGALSLVGAALLDIVGLFRR